MLEHHEKQTLELDANQIEFIANSLSFVIAALDHQHCPPAEERDFEKKMEFAFDLIHRCSHKRGSDESINAIQMQLRDMASKYVRTSIVDDEQVDKMIEESKRDDAVLEALRRRVRNRPPSDLN